MSILISALGGVLALAGYQVARSVLGGASWREALRRVIRPDGGGGGPPPVK